MGKKVYADELTAGLQTTFACSWEQKHRGRPGALAQTPLSFPFHQKNTHFPFPFRANLLFVHGLFTIMWYTELYIKMDVTALSCIAHSGIERKHTL